VTGFVLTILVGSGLKGTIIAGFLAYLERRVEYYAARR